MKTLLTSIVLDNVCILCAMQLVAEGQLFIFMMDTHDYVLQKT
jgi:hypothetical protein